MHHTVKMDRESQQDRVTFRNKCACMAVWITWSLSLTKFKEVYFADEAFRVQDFYLNHPQCLVQYPINQKMTLYNSLWNQNFSPASPSFCYLNGVAGNSWQEGFFNPIICNENWTKSCPALPRDIKKRNKEKTRYDRQCLKSLFNLKLTNWFN